MRCLIAVLSVVVLAACSGDGDDDGLRAVPPSAVAATTSLAETPATTVAPATTTTTTNPPTTTTDPWARPSEPGNVNYWQRVVTEVDNTLGDAFIAAVEAGQPTSEAMKLVDAATQNADRERQRGEVTFAATLPREYFQDELAYRNLKVLAILRERPECVVLEIVYDNSAFVSDPNPPEVAWAALRPAERTPDNPSGWSYDVQTDDARAVDLEAWCPAPSS